MFSAEKPAHRHIGDDGSLGKVGWEPPLVGHVLTDQGDVIGRPPGGVSHRRTERKPVCPALSTTLFNGVSHRKPRPAYDSPGVVGRRSYNTALGAFWRDLREKKRLGLRQSATIAIKRGFAGFSKSTIENLEKGTKHPAVSTVRAAAAIYGVDYQWLVSEITRLTFDDVGRAAAQPPAAPTAAPLSLDMAMTVAVLEVLPDDLRSAVGSQIWVMAEHLRIEPPPERIAELAHVPVLAASTRLRRARRR